MFISSIGGGGGGSRGEGSHKLCNLHIVELADSCIFTTKLHQQIISLACLASCNEAGSVEDQTSCSPELWFREEFCGGRGGGIAAV